jgi:hypothetical protein
MKKKKHCGNLGFRREEVEDDMKRLAPGKVKANDT